MFTTPISTDVIMKSKKALNLLLAGVFILSCAFSCDEDDPPKPPTQLPPITQTGAYTFGCLLDGEVWLPKSYSISIVNPSAVLFVDYSTGLFKIIATHDRKNEDSPKQVMGFYLYHINRHDSIYWDTVDTNSFFAMEILPPNTGGANKSYMSLSNSNSWIYLSRFDTINRIASGTFSVDLLNVDDDQDTVHIREGRFDVSL